MSVLASKIFSLELAGNSVKQRPVVPDRFYKHCIFQDPIDSEFLLLTQRVPLPE